VKTRLDWFAVAAATARLKRKISRSLFAFALIAAFAWFAEPAVAAKSTAALSPTTVTLAISAAGSPVTTTTLGTTVTLTATPVSGGAAVFPAIVKFCDATLTSCDSATEIGAAHVTSAGTAILRVRPGIGNHSYTAVFLGNTVAASAVSAAAMVSVTGKLPSATTLTEIGDVGSYALTAQVAGAGLAPSGSVSFLDSDQGKDLGAATLGDPTFSLETIANPTPVAGDVIGKGDFNNDGLADVVTMNQVAISEGNGTFMATYTLPAGTIYVLVGDFNGDGNLDLLSSDEFGAAAKLLFGDGAGHFAEGPTQIKGTNAAAVGDFNNDGIDDLLLFDGTVDLGHGDGTFTKAGVAQPCGSNEACSPFDPVAVGDFNGDGNLDFAAPWSTDTGGTYELGLTVFFGDGEGDFTPTSTVLDGNEGDDVDMSQVYASVIAGDVNGDGKTDLVISFGNFDWPAGEYWSYVAELVNDGTGAFTYPGRGNAFYGAYASGVLGNFSGSGVQLAVNLGDSLSFMGVNYPLSSGAALVAGDFDGAGLTGFANGINTYSFNNAKSAQLNGITVSPAGTGAHRVQASYEGDDNFNSSVSPSVLLDSAAADVALQLSASANSVAYGTPINLTATITGTSGTPTGTVTFYNGNAMAGTGTVTGGVATFVLNNLATGNYSLTAKYSGDSNDSSATSAPLVVTVTKQNPTLTLAGPSDTVPFGNPVVLTAKLAVIGPVPTATITATGPGGTQATGALDSNGVATLTFASITPVGQSSYTASFAGNSDFSAVTSNTVNVTIGKDTPTLTLSPSATSITYGSTETLTALIYAGGMGATGLITFQYGSLTLGASTINDTVATFATNALPAGSDVLTATFAGNTDHAAVTSAPVTVQVAPLLVILASQATVYSGVSDAITINLNVGSNSAVPTGTITLSGSNYNPAPVALVSGSATVTVPANTLPAGDVTLTAAYSGDSVYPASSAKLALTVSSNPPPGFTITAPALSIAAGATNGNTSSVSLTPVTGFTGTVALAAAITSAPPNAIDMPTVSFSGGNTVAITGASPATATLTITTTAPKTTTSSSRGQWLATGGAALACLTLIGFPGRRGGKIFRNSVGRMLGLVLALISIVAGLSSCGGSSSGGTSPHLTPGTTPGDYTVTITGSAGSIVQTGTLNLTVQ